MELLKRKRNEKFPDISLKQKYEKKKQKRLKKMMIRLLQLTNLLSVS